jgi:hypothetical protein
MIKLVNGEKGKEVKANISFSDLLLLLFVALKLTNVISWSWFWVLSPIWITVGVVIIVAIIAGIISVTKK